MKKFMAVCCSIYVSSLAISDEIGRSSRLIEEVMVTAQKREENSQDVPIMITAFSEDKLDAFGIENTADLARITPGLTFTYTYGYAVIYLRGVGTDAFLANTDPSIATYIDGINLPASQGKMDSLGPVQRVEVLKGPQGTLFGRNATGGAISIVTADPSEEFIGNLKAEKSKYNSESYQLFMGGMVTSSLGATVALFKDSNDPYGKNLAIVNGEPGPIRDEFSEGARLKLKWDISDTISATFIGSYINQFNGKSLMSQENSRPSAILAGGVPAEEEDRDFKHNYDGGSANISTLYGLIVDWSPGPVDLKFIYADTNMDVDWTQYDFDSSENSQATFSSYDQYNMQTTYELQLLSNEDSWLSSNLEWVAGLYRLEGEGGYGRLLLSLNALGFVSNVVGLPEIVSDLLVNQNQDIILEAAGILETESNSAYLQGTWSFNSEWSLTLGARYQEETRGISESYLDLVNTLPTPPPASYFEGNDYSRNVRLAEFEVDDVEDKTFSPKVSVQYFPADQVQMFASLQRAYKSPTYNIVNFFSSPESVDREEVTAFEIGVKSDLFDGNLRLNAAYFKTETKDLLTAVLSITSGGIVRFDNAGEAETEGAEADFMWQPMPVLNPGLAIAGNATYIDATYTDYKNGAGFDDDTGLYFGPDGVVGDTSRDFTNNRVVRTPRFSSSMSVNQFVGVTDNSDIELGLDYYYNSGFYATPQNSEFYVQDQYELWNARVSYFYNPTGIQLTAFVNNIKDKDYYSAILQHDFGRSVTLAPPMTYGMRIKWNFDVLL
ncbi:outer membrane receptor protein [Spongiibacter sp. IMCC21906]|uniref:TonB-dependent receptor n=1 Tax=Spongiibacter sp. IMCC21906 TaxID=1620392 RepID=UPI00062DF5E7|nr:TonB-dependent receptor [Spongiibacter sp. IMCC21906]AKH68087.1 outer membrane receptor protein [Spongiibacter sp. IMCC21906]